MAKQQHEAAQQQQALDLTEAHKRGEREAADLRALTLTLTLTPTPTLTLTLTLTLSRRPTCEPSEQA